MSSFTGYLWKKPFPGDARGGSLLPGKADALEQAREAAEAAAEYDWRARAFLARLPELEEPVLEENE
jgi:hypothetical protein